MDIDVLNQIIEAYGLIVNVIQDNKAIQSPYGIEYEVDFGYDGGGMDAGN